jgi:hypothetical protein
MHDSSSTPWATISRSTSLVVPAPTDTPRTAPRITPLKISDSAVPSPAVIPAANASSATWRGGRRASERPERFPEALDEARRGR